MIKIIKIRALAGNKALMDLIADNKAEVVNDGQIVGLEKNGVIDFGSTVLTTDGHYAIRNSSGEWVWQDEDEETAQTSSVSPNVSPQTLSLGRSILNGIETNELTNYEEPVINEPYEEPEELNKR